ncbi:glycoside hydrolase family 3 N-terminal domain-containing protein [Brevundimonas sp.]|uniref:glycoside hydrolase family 3 protein n=1 Tax=Brevundimonas sp. TaxID=1871086 RepID=UPI0025B92787|nr:glycoside hydrolase family 3 N-terminal domain-containing protein [Brevundimonas sp.]
MRRTAASLIALTIALGGASSVLAQTIPVPEAARANPAIWPHAATPAAISDAQTDAFVTDLIRRMTLEEKVGQLIQADISSITPEDLKTYPLGSILAGGSSGPWGDDKAAPPKWLELAQAFRAANAARGGTVIPLIYGIDAVHGHNNVPGATIFPHNIGLGAARDPDLIHRIGVATALEVAVTGADWTFGPTLAVPRDDRWGRTYEGYAENPEVQRAYAGPMTLGLQGQLVAGQPLAPGHIAGSAKHFLADGGTDGGKDQGDFIGTEQELIDIHLGGYVQAIDAGVLSIMASFSSWNGYKHSGNDTLLRDVLHGPLGFKGFVVSDWNAHGQLPGCTNESCALAVNAGIDMLMAPDSWKPLYASTLAQARSGEIPAARIEDAVRRILTAKVKTGLFNTERPVEGRFEELASPAHRALAREAVQKSLVLLKNEGVLPIRANARVLVAGTAADDIGQASGGWTLSWQGTGNTNADFPQGQSIWAGINEAVSQSGGTAALSADGSFTTKPDVAIVVFGESPYAEFQGDVDNLAYVPTAPLETLKRLKAAGIPTVSVFLSGRPMWTNPEINQSDAFVAAWLPGTEGAGVADLLIGDRAGKPRHDFTGKLSFSWPKDAKGEPLNVGQPGYDPQFAYGYGLSYAHPVRVGRLSEDSGVAVAAANLDRYFVDGRFVSPWGLLLNDAGGQTRPGTAKSASSPRSGVISRPIDDLAQESGQQFAYAGSGPASVEIWGTPVDLIRQANGAVALSFRYRIDAAPSDTVRLSLGGGAVDVTNLLKSAPAARWQVARIPLTCFRTDGGDLSRVEVPFHLTTPGSLTISVSEIKLDASQTETRCPT